MGKKERERERDREREIERERKRQRVCMYVYMCVCLLMGEGMNIQKATEKPWAKTLFYFCFQFDELLPVAETTI